jgi:hypothetical protein
MYHLDMMLDLRSAPWGADDVVSTNVASVWERWTDPLFTTVWSKLVRVSDMIRVAQYSTDGRLDAGISDPSVSHKCRCAPCRSVVVEASDVAAAALSLWGGVWSGVVGLGPLVQAVAG